MPETAQSISQNVPDDRLAVFETIGAWFSLFFGRFPQVFILGLVPAICTNLFIHWTISPLLISPDTRWIAVALTNVVGMIGAGITTALVVQYAIDTMNGRPMRIGHYLATIGAVLFPLCTCSVITGSAVILVVLLIVAPGLLIGNLVLTLFLTIPALVAALFVASLWACVTPVIVMERAGFRALARSPQLTKGHRLAVIGAVAIALIVGGILLQGGTYFTRFLGNPDTMSISMVMLVQNSVQTVIAGFVAGFLGVFSAVLYTRLRALKDGNFSDDVFA